MKETEEEEVESTSVVINQLQSDGGDGNMTPQVTRSFSHLINAVTEKFWKLLREEFSIHLCSNRTSLKERLK